MGRSKLIVTDGWCFVVSGRFQLKTIIIILSSSDKQADKRRHPRHRRRRRRWCIQQIFRLWSAPATSRVHHQSPSSTPQRFILTPRSTPCSFLVHCRCCLWKRPICLNPLDLIGTLKPQSNGSLYRNTVIGTLAVDGWAVTFGTARRSLGGHPSTAVSVQTSYYSVWHYNYLCPLKG